MLLFLFSLILATQNTSSERLYQFLLTTAQLLRWEQRFEERAVVVSISGAPELSTLAASRSRLEQNRRKQVQFKKRDDIGPSAADIVFIGTPVPAEQHDALAAWAKETKCLIISTQALPASIPAVQVVVMEGRIRWIVNDAVYEAGILSRENPFARAALTPQVASL